MRRSTRSISGAYDLAEQILEDSLADVEERFGGDLPLAEHLWVLGTTLDLNRRHARAEALLRRGAAIFEERLGSRSPSFASCIATLASVLVWRSKLEEGERLLQRALAIHRAAGRPSDDVVDALNSLGWLYCHQR